MSSAAARVPVVLSVTRLPDNGEATVRVQPASPPRPSTPSMLGAACCSRRRCSAALLARRARRPRHSCSAALLPPETARRPLIERPHASSGRLPRVSSHRGAPARPLVPGGLDSPSRRHGVVGSSAGRGGRLQHCSAAARAGFRGASAALGPSRNRLDWVSSPSGPVAAALRAKGPWPGGRGRATARSIEYLFVPGGCAVRGGRRRMRCTRGPALCPVACPCRSTPPPVPLPCPCQLFTAPLRRLSGRRQGEKDALPAVGIPPACPAAALAPSLALLYTTTGASLPRRPVELGVLPASCE